MLNKEIKRWITDEYAKERNTRIMKLKAEGKDPWTPWTEEKAEKLKEEARQRGIQSRQETLKAMKELGAEKYIAKCIEDVKKLIIELKNPTPEEKYMYTEAFFEDLLKTHENSLMFYESLYNDKEKLQNNFNALKERLENLENEEDIKVLLEIPKTKYPNEFITPKDKISNMLFNGELSEELKALKMERNGSKKELTAKVSIGFDELTEVQLSNRNITPYDREVHDAIVSLYIDGKNEYITPLMIYRTMTGNPSGKLTDKIFNDITESLERCSITRVNIDASEEVEGKGYNIGQPIFKENLLYTRSVKGLYNGEMGEWIQIIQPPILYKYASCKNQVARMDIKLLNTPVNKNEETIILQGYLQRRILSMKGSSLSKNILYETVYKQLDLKMASPASLRNKQSKIRDTIKNILDYWKEEGFISDFKENTGPRNSKISISIVL